MIVLPGFIPFGSSEIGCYSHPCLRMTIALFPRVNGYIINIDYELIRGIEMSKGYPD